jgi:hypothetical protein
MIDMVFASVDPAIMEKVIAAIRAIISSNLVVRRLTVTMATAVTFQ